MSARLRTPARGAYWAAAVTVGAAYLFLGSAVRDAPAALDVLAAQTLPALAWTPLGYALDLLNWLGQAVLWMGAVLALAMLFVVFRRPLVAGALVVGLGSEVLVAIGKTAFDRARPLPPLGESIASVDLGSYPSGHVTRIAVTLGVILLFAVPRERRPTFAVISAAVIALVALARVAFLEHWTSDTLGGLLLAVAWVSATRALASGQSTRADAAEQGVSAARYRSGRLG